MLLSKHQLHQTISQSNEKHAGVWIPLVDVKRQERRSHPSPFLPKAASSQSSMGAFTHHTLLHIKG
jgi:hypothetical protein